MLDENSSQRRTHKPPRSCSACAEVLDSFEVCKKSLDKERKNYSLLLGQYQKLQNEIKGVKSMYNELKETHEELLHELRENEKTAGDQEMGQLNKLIAQMNSDNQRLLDEYSEIHRAKTSLEASYVELAKKSENEQARFGKIQAELEEVCRENEAKQATIEKAQGFIKKLNDESEKLCKELNRAETELNLLKKDMRVEQKNWLDSKKKFSEIEVCRKTEERLRDENYALKNRISEVVSKKDAEIANLNQIAETLMYEKSNLERDMEELEEKLNEIDVLNRERIQVYNLTCAKLAELEAKLKEKDEEILDLQRNARETEERKEQELRFVKQQAENLVRSLKNSGEPRLAQTSDLQELKQAENARQVQELASFLEESLKRESDFKSALNRIIESESKTLKSCLDSCKNSIAELTRQTEKWIMRNEEMEQRLFDSLQQNKKLLGTVSDLKKLVEIKNHQLEDSSSLRLQDSEAKEKIIEMLRQEIFRLNNAVTAEIIPASQQALDKSLHLAHQKIRKNLQDLERTQVIFEDTKVKNDLSSAKIERLLCENLDLNKKLKFLDDELETLYSLMQTGNLNPSDFERCSDRTKEMLSKIKDIHFCNEKIIESRGELKGLVEKLEQEKDMVKYELDTQVDSWLVKEKLIKDENLKLVEENKYLKSIALKDKEEKILLKTHVEEEILYFKSQAEYLKKLLTNTESERLRTETENNQLRKDMERFILEYEKILSEKKILQKCYEELSEKNWKTFKYN